MFDARRISYEQTNAFTKIISDYLKGEPELRPFYSEQPHQASIIKAIQQKQQQAIDRRVLVSALTEQYKDLPVCEAVHSSIQELLSDQTFTICTAHQPNLFTGPLYFIYKILHVIKLAETLKKELPQFHFVPVYYMGSEDADLQELNHFTIDNKRYEWKTDQTGSVGRMIIDQHLMLLIDELERQLSVYPHGQEWISLLRDCFQPGKTIQAATFELVHTLFSSYGLVILIADHHELKKTMQPVFEEDILKHIPASLVTQSSALLNQHYAAQAHVRDINLFYLKDNIRERIERKGEGFMVCNTSITFSQDSLIDELRLYPEHFSPNVILRGLFQETILPNIAFIGGGGEVAYWLQLKSLFEYYKVAFPLLVLRNSFLVIEKKWKPRIQKLGLREEDLFQSSEQLFHEFIQKQSTNQLSLNGKLEAANSLYESIKQQAETIDPTLVPHVKSLQVRAVQKLQDLEKKMIRAEKRKFTSTKQQIDAVKSALFPKGGLQERVENTGHFYAKWGGGFVKQLYRQSLALEQEFTILSEITG